MFYPTAIHRKSGVPHDEHPASCVCGERDGGEASLRGLAEAPRGQQGQQRPRHGAQRRQGHGEHTGALAMVAEAAVVVVIVAPSSLPPPPLPPPEP